MERKDLLKANAAIFQGQGKALDKYANRNVKVLVVGNPANTNALIAATNAPNLPAENFTAMTRLDQSRASEDTLLHTCQHSHTVTSHPPQPLHTPPSVTTSLPWTFPPTRHTPLNTSPPRYPFTGDPLFMGLNQLETCEDRSVAFRALRVPCATVS